MTRAELITELHAVRAEMETLLADVGETWLTEPGALPGWSVKDILAHITSWEVDLLTNLGKVRRGVKPGKTRWASAEIQAQNEKSYAELKDRPLHTVLEDFRGARRQTIRVLEGLTESEVESPADWLHGRSIEQYVVANVLHHEQEHVEELKAWRQNVT